MKITITLTENEKMEAIRNYARETKTTEIKDDAERIEGNFGTFDYVPAERKFELELTEAFVFAFIQLLMSFIGMMKSLGSMFEMFGSYWFKITKHAVNGKDTVGKPKEKEAPEDDLQYVPVGNVNH